jgi:hypothetical protein
MNTDARNLNVGINAKPLRSTLHRLAAGIAVLALASPLLAWADCTDTRKPTAAEIEFFNRGTAALVAALPPVPVNGKLARKDSLPHGLGSNQCVGQTGDFSLEVRRDYEHNSRGAEVTIVMNMAQWQVTGANPSATYGTLNPGRSAGLKVNNLMWIVRGSDSPLRKALAEAMDRERLQALVGKPLPSVAESQALAAQAVPATIAAAPAAAPAAAAGPAAPATQSATQPVAARPAAGQPPASEPMRDAVDAVNTLRGLFGR